MERITKPTAPIIRSQPGVQALIRAPQIPVS